MKKNLKHELLVPVGDFESLIAAINNGADAVYLGGKKFGARAFANNFTEEELEKVIKLCHLYDVKVYITVNTLVLDSEIEEALKYVKKIHQFGVDAVIMQDVGLINLVHQTLPNLEIHASTQMHNHSKESLAFLKELGIKRVVFAREVSLDYINSIDTDVEKEVFIHGSLCISYSGQCLFSSCILNRSGNRGECAGMCRLPYKLLENEKYIEANGNYLLSPKDLCTLEYFKKLLDSDVVSFKIEGRMKSPAYVALVTRLYKGLMIQYEKGEELKINERDFELLQAIYNRQYTKGFLLGDHDIMNFMASNHEGLHLGKVIECTPKKIKIKLDRNLHQFEGIRFKESDKGVTLNFLYDENDNLINEGKKGTVVYIDNFINLKSLDEVVLTAPLVDEETIITKKIPVKISCEVILNKPLILKVTDEENEVVVHGEEVKIAQTSPITNERIEKALEKTGNTPFVAEEISVISDNNVFVAISVLNNLRRQALNELKELRENKKVDYVERNFKRELPLYENNGPVINVLARTKKQVMACKELGIKNIIVEEEKLMENYLIFKVPRDKMVHDYKYDNLLVTDYASLDKYPSNIVDYHLNVFNHFTFDYLNKKARSLMLSVELTNDDIKDFMKYYPKGTSAEVLVYGRIELMLMKYCPLNKIVNKNGVCNVCQNDKKYKLEDRNGAKYPIVNNSVTHSTTILHHQVTNKIDLIQMFKGLGINNFRVEFYDETYEETKEILSQIIKEIML